jgi:hypothetical protein
LITPPPLIALSFTPLAAAARSDFILIFAFFFAADAITIFISPPGCHCRYAVSAGDAATLFAAASFRWLIFHFFADLRFRHAIIFAIFASATLFHYDYFLFRFILLSRFTLTLSPLLR